MRRVALVCGLCWLIGCGDSCGCGEAPKTEQAPDQRAQVAELAQPAAEPPAASPPRSDDADAGSDARAARVDPFADKRHHFEPIEDSPLKTKLAAHQEKLQSLEATRALADPQALAQALGERLGKLKADGPVMPAEVPMGERRMAVAVRNYTQGALRGRVKITDAGQLPGMLASVAQRLTSRGNAPTGLQRGFMLQGQPGLTAYFADAQVARATLVVGDRFLVEAIVRGTDDASAALAMLEALPLTKLAKLTRDKPRK